MVADDNALGSGIAISNEQFLTPFTPLTGTINVTGNYLIRAGAYNPNWDHPMGAVQFDSYDSAFSGVTVNYSGGAILDSPYEAFEFVSGSGNGYAISGLNISNVNVANVGTVVMQAETTGSASVSGVTASGVGVPGAYNYAYPSNTAGAFTFNLGSGNSGWSTTPVLTAYPNPVQPGALNASPTTLSFGDVASGSTSSAQTVTVSNPGSSAASVSSVSVTGAFSQTNTCGTSIPAGGTCTVSVKFAPTATGSASGNLSVASSAPGSPLTVALSGTGTASTTNLALNAPVTASSYTQVYTPANAVDGNTSTYWEANNGAWPSTFTVNLGSAQTLGSITIDLPPSAAWSTQDPDPVGSRLGQRQQLLHPRRLGHLHLEPVHRQHGHHRAARPGTSDQYVQLELHRQQRPERRPGLRDPDLPVTTARRRRGGDAHPLPAVSRGMGRVAARGAPPGDGSLVLD